MEDKIMTSAKRLFAMAVAGALVVGSMAGCGGSSSTDTSAAASTGSASAAATTDSGNDYTITVITKALDSDYWHVVQAGAILAGNDLGVTVNVLGPNNELDTQGEMNQILDAVSNGTDGLVIAPNDPESLASTIADAHAQGIPTVIIDSQCPDETAFDVFAGTDNYAAGEALGEFVGNDQDDAKAVIIRGQAGSNTHDDRTSGITDGLEATGATLLDAQPADSDQAKAVTVAENMIQSYGDELTAIITTSDDMACGAYQAVAASGKEDQIRVYAFDGSNNGLESMINGEIYADCAQQPFAMGQKGVEICVDLLNGAAVEDIDGIDGTTVDTGYQIITRDDAQEYYDNLKENLAAAGF
jgi:ribose transport system substrate-binding protein